MSRNGRHLPAFGWPEHGSQIFRKGGRGLFLVIRALWSHQWSRQRENPSKVFPAILETKTDSAFSPNPATFRALFTGSIVTHGVGGVFVDFDNTPQFFTFDGACRFGPGICATGSFSFSVNDVALSTDSVFPFTGQVTGA